VTGAADCRGRRADRRIDRKITAATGAMQRKYCIRFNDLDESIASRRRGFANFFEIDTRQLSAVILTG
jgi:hypothetical protein